MRWPEAVPLRGVSATEVAEVFVSVVCCMGIPEAVLTHQGSVFTGRVFGRVCELLGCGRLKTMPYHPQGNGMVERLHGSLKPMLAKAAQQGLGWVKFLPLALFTLRQMPHSDTSLSPFDLVYGSVRGPLDSVYKGWKGDFCQGVDVSKWVQTLQDRLELLHNSCTVRMEAKDKQREKLNVKRSDMRLKVEDKVFMKIPGWSGEFQCAWKDPYSVVEALSCVNYRVTGQSVGKNGRIVHLNNLKCYRERKALRAVVIEDSEECWKVEKLDEAICVGKSLTRCLLSSGRSFQIVRGVVTGRIVTYRCWRVLSP